MFSAFLKVIIFWDSGKMSHLINHLSIDLTAFHKTYGKKFLGKLGTPSKVLQGQSSEMGPSLWNADFCDRTIICQ